MTFCRRPPKLRWIMLMFLSLIGIQTNLSQGGFFIEDPEQKPKTVNDGEQVSFSCTFNVSFIQNCGSNDLRQRTDGISWYSSILPHSELTETADAAVHNLENFRLTMSACSTGMINSTISFIARLHLNSVIFQCAIDLYILGTDNHLLLKPGADVRVWSKAVSLNVSTAGQSNCNTTTSTADPISVASTAPTAGVSTSLNSTSTEAEPTSDCVCPTITTSAVKSISSTIWSIVFLGLLLILPMLLQ